MCSRLFMDHFPAHADHCFWLLQHNIYEALENLHLPTRGNPRLWIGDVRP
jgi:predicted oxidoreductase (fatty acid repression mutant protein)